MVDAKGQLVGFNFDRTWENVAGDYVWRVSQSRNIIADARYLFWMLDEVAGWSDSRAQRLAAAQRQHRPAVDRPVVPGERRVERAEAGAAGGGTGCRSAAGRSARCWSAAGGSTRRRRAAEAAGAAEAAAARESDAPASPESGDVGHTARGDDGRVS